MTKEVTDHIMDETIIIGNTIEETRETIQGMKEETGIEVHDKIQGTEIITVRETEARGGRANDRGPHIKYNRM